MAFLSRLVWSEGMYLGPHHFQAQARYFEDALQFTTSALNYEPYGLIGCTLDEEALRNGTVAVTHARGVFPDGLAFQMPGPDAAPAPRQIRDVFPLTSEYLNVLLAVPARAGSAAGQASEPRYVPERRAFFDETSGGDEQLIELGRKNIKILTSDEPTSGWETLPIARVRRDGGGHFVYDSDFIPPCVQIGSSERLMLMCRTLIEALAEKRNALAIHKEVSDPSPRQLVVLWYLHAIGSGAAALQHIWRTRRGHPEHLYLELSRLGGALATFSLKSSPLDLPAYDHDDLQHCFTKLETFVRTHLEWIVPTNLVSIELSRSEAYIWEGQISDRRCFDRSQWVLAMRSDAPDADLITRAPSLVKICSRRFVGELVRRAVPGLTLTHVTTPPAAIPRRADTQYYSIAKSGPFWEDIVKTGAAGVYIPGDLPNAELEL
jgi:type VI secretion system protein ImpJ